IPLTSATHTVSIVDMNGDGKMDLVAEADSARALDVFLGNGDGTFQAPKTTYALSATGGQIYGPIVDLNGDGKPDVVVAYQYLNEVGVFLGNGDGTFQPEALYDAGDGPNTFAVGDFNRDGILDLAISQANQPAIIELLGTGGGKFTSPITIPTGGSGN